jgi:lipoate-protein ligase A
VRPWLLELLLFDDVAPHSAAMNMAIDESLLAAIQTPILRVYRWERPAVSFGYFEQWQPVRKLHPTRDPVRRWTGGGVVLHGQDLTYSLLIPRTINAGAPGESYRLIHGALCRALGEIGLAAQPAGSSSARRSHACFENPVLHDVLVGAQKVAGAAQRRTRAGLLHQGSIQSLELTPDFPTRFASHLAAKIKPHSFNITAAAENLAAKKYATRAWLERLPATIPKPAATQSPANVP